MSTTAERQTHVSYLLGRLPDEEASALEEQYFRDPELFDRLTALETDLLDEYARGELSGGDRSDFERRLEKSPILRSRLESAVAIQQALSAPAAASTATVRPRSRFPWLTGLAAAAAVVLAVVGVRLSRDNERLQTGLRQAELVERRLADENQALHHEIAVRNAQGTSPDSKAPSGPNPGPSLADLTGRVFTFRLAPGQLRDLQASNDVVVPKGIAAVLLEIPVGSGSGWRYRIRVETTSGEPLLDQNDVAGARRRGGDVAVLAFPASTIPAGDYVLKVSRRRDGVPPEPVSDLAFRIAYR